MSKILQLKDNALLEALKDNQDEGEHPCPAQGGYADQKYCESWCHGKGCMYWDFKEKVCKLNEQANEGAENV